MVIVDAPELSPYVTPKSAKVLPVYNWYTYPHSYSPELVWRLIDDFQLEQGDQILDPFVGAGTSLLAAKQRDISAVGIDLLPISAVLAKAKTSEYDKQTLYAYLQKITRFARSSRQRPTDATSRLYFRSDGIVARAFDESTFFAFVRLKRAIFHCVEPEEYRAFFLTCLMYLIEPFSRTMKSGGWLKITGVPRHKGSLFAAFDNRAKQMIEDVKPSPAGKGSWRVVIGDARVHHPEVGACSAIITSPPYLNRHDYTRVLSLELLLTILTSYDEMVPLRHQLLRSHVEAKPYPSEPEYEMPESLKVILDELNRRNAERRILYITEGYFEDMYSVLKRCAEYLRTNGKIALVLGNVRFCGLSIPVDEIIVDLASAIGLTWEKTLVARRRNNSAQQMRDFGRDPARENIIILSK
jgi:DNA modification methylase